MDNLLTTLNYFLACNYNIIDFNYGPGNSFWHTPHDNSENVSRESLDKTGRIISRMIMEFDEL